MRLAAYRNELQWSYMKDKIASQVQSFTKSSQLKLAKLEVQGYQTEIIGYGNPIC